MLIPVAALLALLGAGVFSDAGPSAVSGVPGQEQRKKGSHADDFLVFGTVFTEQGFALPGATIKVRRAGERKVRGEAYSDRRGEFAVRVPQGAEYEVSVTAKRYREEKRKVDARTGNREDLVFRLEPLAGRKPK